MREDTATLYARLGGYDGIAAVVDDFLPRLKSDPSLTRFWAHRSEDTLRRQQQLLVDYISESTGGPMYFTGRELKIAHEGMGITAADWDAMIGHLQATFEEFGVPEAERDEVVAFVQSKRADIVDE